MSPSVASFCIVLGLGQWGCGINVGPTEWNNTAGPVMVGPQLGLICLPKSTAFSSPSFSLSMISRYLGSSFLCNNKLAGTGMCRLASIPVLSEIISRTTHMDEYTFYICSSSVRDRSIITCGAIFCSRVCDISPTPLNIICINRTSS